MTAIASMFEFTLLGVFVAFTVPFIYIKKRDVIDRVIQKAMQRVNGFRFVLYFLSHHFVKNVFREKYSGAGAKKKQ